MLRLLLATCCSLLATIAFAQNKNVGIGTTTPQAQLHTTGSVRFDTLKGIGLRPVYVNSAGSLVTADSLKEAYTASPAAAIPDGPCTGLNNTITVSGLATSIPSENISVRLNINHTQVGDIFIYLISPSGQVLNLAFGNGSGGDNFSNTIFSDLATQTLPGSAAPFTSVYKPVGSVATTCNRTGTVSTFAGFGGGTINPNGNWTLQVIDVNSGNQGSLSNWSIDFTGSFSAQQPNYLLKSGPTARTSAIYENGRVGIFTSTPAADVDIVGDTLGLRNASSWDNLWFNVDGATANINASGAESGLNFKVGSNNSGAYGNGQTLNTAMTLLPNGHIGIGTATPATRLQVVDSSVLFSAAGPVGTINNPPITGAGRRMMWWPGKAAFRTGYVSGNYWDKDSVGNYSFAAGYNTKARSNYSVALGQETQATGSAAFATGYGSVASGDGSTALGFQTAATGFQSTALGTYTQAIGTASFAAGTQSTASGTGATVIGYLNTASGILATAIGQLSYAGSDVATAIGYQDSATGHTSFAAGGGNYARSWGEVAVGSFNLNYTPAGFNSIVSSDRAFSVGNGTGNSNRSNALTVIKDGRIGIGTAAPFSQLSNTTKNTIGGDGAGGNPGSFAWSANQYGYAAQIFNEGNSPIANGLAVKVLNDNAMAFDVTYGSQESPGFPLFNVRANGNVGIGTNLPAVKLDIMAGPFRQAMRVCSGRGQSDNNGILIIQDSSNNTAASPNNELVLFLNAGGGIIGTISRNSNANSIAFNSTSDARLKTGIRPTRYGLRDLMNIQVTDYRYKGINNAAQQTGFLAQQLYSIYPEAVTKGDDADEAQPYMVDYSKLTPLLVKSVQELKAENDALKAEVAEMKAMLKKLLKKAKQ